MQNTMNFVTTICWYQCLFLLTIYGYCISLRVTRWVSSRPVNTRASTRLWYVKWKTFGIFSGVFLGCIFVSVTGAFGFVPAGYDNKHPLHVLSLCLAILQIGVIAGLYGAEEEMRISLGMKDFLLGIPKD